MEEISQKDLSTIERFKLKAQEFMTALNRLQSLEGQVQNNPELQSEYNSLLNTASFIKSSIESVTSTIDSVTGFFSNMFNLNGAGAVQGYINEPYKSQNLGIVLPLLPIAAIGAVIMAMTKIIGDIYLFERKVTETKRIENKGYTPKEAADIVAANLTNNNSIFGDVTGMVTPLVIIGGLFFAYKFFK